MDQKENQDGYEASGHKAVKGSSDEHGGNRSGNQKKKKDKPQRSSQAAGKDPNRGED